jgi:predicted nucleotidyltransferase
VAYNVAVSVPTAGETAARLEESFRANPRGIAAVYLYGSATRDTARESSDVDVAVLLERDPPRTLEHRLDDLLAFSRAIRARLPV